MQYSGELTYPSVTQPYGGVEDEIRWGQRIHECNRFTFQLRKRQEWGRCKRRWLFGHTTYILLNILREVRLDTCNPFTPESDQCQNSPAASQEIWHHTVRRTWLFIAYSDERWLYYQFSLHHSYNRFLKGWENTLFELRSERVKRLGECCSPQSTMWGSMHGWRGRHLLSYKNRLQQNRISRCWCLMLGFLRQDRSSRLLIPWRDREWKDSADGEVER